MIDRMWTMPWPGCGRFGEKDRANVPSQSCGNGTRRGTPYDGLVARTVYPTVPPKVEYALTGLGQTLTGAIAALGDWARANGAAMAEARAKFDAAHQTPAAPMTSGAS